MHRHSDATLMGMTKKELVAYVRMTEHNYDVAREQLHQQAENVKDWKPVVHGKWQWLGPYRYNDEGMIGTCSACKTRMRLFETGFCPRCGAKMDGGRKADR